MLTKRNKKKIFLILILSTLIIVFFSLNINFYLSNFLAKNLSYSSDYYSENSRLKNKIEELESKVKLQQSYVNENIELKKRLEYKVPKNIKFLQAELVIASPFTFASSGIINKGIKDGVKSGFIAIASGKLVGKVASVKTDYSEILFTFNPNFAIMVYIGKNKIPGILKGNGVTSYIKYVTNDQKILKGDKVLISSNSPEQYPPIEIGKIASVKKEGGFLDMDLDGLIEPRNIKFLTIVSND